ncbi:hypothetical protein BG015_002875 [Linnemannia schmuckeri]|uniref:C3H1-type domain-containing protein n=1 Tax=Linnemannia schmuckeri TaxID=64567 RepID=A0A9P5S754_9FUNG|nr:hypothetical protein BG015_002875 [Linnemannia schmuckeri]
MRYSTTTALIAATSMVLLACSSFTNNNLASAALTPQERLETEARDSTNPNYCPDCLKKALLNHFPHACPSDLQPMVAITRPSGPTPAERRCICIAFLDLFWMKSDCSAECAFVHDADAMSHLLTAKSIPGCEKYVDFETGTELEIEGFEKKDPEYVPEVYEQATREEAEAQAAAQERAHAEAYPAADAAEAVEAREKQEKEPLEELAFDFDLNSENAPKITIKMDNFIRNPDGSIPNYALAEMAAEAEAKAKAEAEAAAAVAGETEAESKVKDEL